MATSAHVYNADFYDYIARGSSSSARAVVPLVLRHMSVGSIVDVGAGNGRWLDTWMAQGVSDALAVDGDYVDQSRLAIPPQNFVAHDLAQPLDLARRFDLVQSLEVAEHIAQDRADGFVDSLCSHGDIVLFSAAVPNQGGEFHVNEQPPEYWRRKFASRGYDCFDWLRPLIADQQTIKPWYRFNMIMYANPAGQRRLSETVLESRVPDAVTVPERGDLAWRARRLAVALIPKGSAHTVAMLKSAIVARVYGRRS